MDLEFVKTIVVVMMENRSFDHMLGYLSLPPVNNAQVDGQSANAEWLAKVANPLKGESFAPFLLTNPYNDIDADPPHERPYVTVQMGEYTGAAYPMNGFVENYAEAKGALCLTHDNPPPVMGYFGRDQAPVTAFLAESFAVCDRWFASLPAGTQPNRLMAMSGVSTIEINQKPLPKQDLVYDWLTRKGVRWRVYHETVPFFAMMPRCIPDILTSGRFRPFADLAADIETDPPGEFPEVIFIEPAYTDCPHVEASSDDHAPSAIKGGQAFLLEAYQAMTSDPDLWRGMVMIVTYDEHGGFFDHVSPPRVVTTPPLGADYTERFESLGVRVPAVVISPFAKGGSVHHELLDHTSILKFIGQKFGGGGGYSPAVDGRPVGSVADILSEPGLIETPPIVPSLVPYLAEEPKLAGFTQGSSPQTVLQWGFQEALDSIRAHPNCPTEGTIHKLLSGFPPRMPGAPA